MNKLLSIKEAALILGVSVQTLRRWERQGKLVAAQCTKGGQRRYDRRQLIVKSSAVNNPLTIAYARVSSHDQKEDLKKQEEVLELFCAAHGWVFEIISDLGSGLNYDKRGLKKLLHCIMNDEITRLVLTHKDRLLRFGAELIFTFCKEKNIEVVIINQGEPVSFEEELAADVLEIITVFSSKLYGSRSHKNKKLLDELKKIVQDVEK